MARPKSASALLFLAAVLVAAPTLCGSASAGGDPVHPLPFIVLHGEASFAFPLWRSFSA